MAGYTNPRTASPGVIENIKRLRAGQPLMNTVDRRRGITGAVRTRQAGGSALS